MFQFFDDNEVVVYQGVITLFKHIKDFILMSVAEDLFFELRYANKEEAERYLKRQQT